MSVLLLLGAQDPSLSEVVDGTVRTYSKMTDFSAEFVQNTQDISNQRHTYRGLLYLKSGRRMLYDQREPERKILGSDGKVSWEYKVVPKQAEVGPLKKAEDERFQLFQIPWRSDWKDQFTFEGRKFSEQPATPGNYVFRAIPRKKDLPVILLEVNPKTFQIQRFVTTTPDGETNEFRFTGIKTAEIDKTMFELKLPKDVEVIRNR